MNGPELDGEFEGELREALARRAAPVDLKRKVMEHRGKERRGLVVGFKAGESSGRVVKHNRMVWLERIAASLVLAGVAGSAAVGHYAVERRKGEEAKRQVFTALRITNHAFEVMNEQFRKNKE
jgi:hypothetical protein